MYGLRGLGDPSLNAAGAGTCTCLPDGTCQETGNSCAYAGTGGAPMITCPAGSVPNQNILGMWSCVPTTSTAPGSQTFGQWLNANGLYVGLGLAGLVFVMAAVKR